MTNHIKNHAASNHMSNTVEKEGAGGIRIMLIVAGVVLAVGLGMGIYRDNISDEAKKRRAERATQPSEQIRDFPGTFPESNRVATAEQVASLVTFYRDVAKSDCPVRVIKEIEGRRRGHIYTENNLLRIANQCSHEYFSTTHSNRVADQRERINSIIKETSQ